MSCTYGRNDNKVDPEIKILIQFFKIVDITLLATHISLYSTEFPLKKNLSTQLSSLTAQHTSPNIHISHSKCAEKLKHLIHISPLVSKRWQHLLLSTSSNTLPLIILYNEHKDQQQQAKAVSLLALCKTVFYPFSNFWFSEFGPHCCATWVAYIDFYKPVMEPNELSWHGRNMFYVCASNIESGCVCVTLGLRSPSHTH